MKRNSWIPALLAAALAATACGGPSGPGPLGHTLDNQYIVAISPSQQQGVIAAEQQVTVATKERDKADHDWKGVELDLKIAGWELDRAKIGVKIAEARREQAKTAGIAGQNDADARMRAASLGLQTAEAKRSFLQVKRAWLAKWTRYTAHNSYAAEARLQLEKARLAKASDNVPKGFALARFEEQERDRTAKAREARERAEGDLRKAQELQRTWQERDQQWRSATGQPAGSEAAEASASLTMPEEPPPAPPAEPGGPPVTAPAEAPVPTTP